MGKMDKTLENMAAIYIAEHIDNLRSSHKARQVITRDVLPHLPNKKISKIKRHHIGLMLAAHKNRHGTRAIAFRQSRAMFNWLHNFGYVKRSPMAGMSAPAPLKARERYLSDKEIKLLWRATRTATKIRFT